ncbi:FecCD family ABC transporter permease [Nocardia vermiculata]|uniref:FecCD family ABC transporter permease n=1 Tax=Nocardia vermiculata TaxID=257274 RepID=UPI000A7ADBD8|nr:iron ABC transporter permease [Nocardia vermiculata]
MSGHDPAANGASGPSAQTAHPDSGTESGQQPAHVGSSRGGADRATGTQSVAADTATTGEPGPRVPRWSKVTIVFAVSLALLVVLALLSAALGQVPTTPLEVAGSVLHRIGLDWGPLPHHPAGEVTLWEVRFPRVMLAILVGAALATAGALLQGVFANPLAEPGVIGVSAGAAVGAGVVIVVGGAFAAAWSVAAGAFVAGLITTLAVYLLSRSGGRTETVTLVLTGVAVNAVAGGVMSFLLFTASPAARDQIVFWQMGSLNGATWQAVGVVAPLTAIGVAAAVLLAPRLDLLALGEAAARHLGVDVERLRRNVIVIVAILTTAGVAFNGIVLFVGLIVPHVVRMLVGPAHRVLIPLSAILGAVVLLGADIGARTLVHNADLPLGMLTSLVGGPFFFWLLRRTRARSGGWA